MGIWRRLLKPVLGCDKVEKEEPVINVAAESNTQAWLRQYEILKKRYTQSKPYEFHFSGCTSVPQDPRVAQFMQGVDKLYEVTFPEKAAETRRAWQNVMDFCSPKYLAPPTEEEHAWSPPVVDPWQPVVTRVGIKIITGPSPTWAPSGNDGGFIT